MPRKRPTRAKTTRAKPKLTDEDEVNGMTAEERKSKLASLIKDFDYNVENIYTQYDEELEALQSEIEKHFYHIRCKLSSMELQLTVEKYIEFTLSEEEEKQDTVAMPMTSTTASIPSSLQNSKNALSKYKSRQIIETIPEEGGPGGQPTTSKRQGGRKRAAANKGQGVTFNAEPLSTAHNNFITPAAQRTFATTGWGATPLVTPKFDPRLPITPANSRRVQPGEVAMSLAGSPLHVEGSSRSKTLVLNNGEEIDIEIPDRANINSLMSTLRDIMRKGKEA